MTLGPGVERDAETTADEADLIARARQGDHDAYEILVGRYTPLLLRVTLRLLRDEVQAEDATQEAFLRAYTHLDSYNPLFRFSTWVSAIARHHCLRLLARRDWAQATCDAMLLHEAFLDDDPELKLLVKERAEAVRQAVAALPPRYSRPLILRHWHDLSYAEIASLTGQSLGAVKTQLHRAREMLAQSLGTGGEAHAVY